MTEQNKKSPTYEVKLGKKKTIALIAHDNRKKDLLAWAERNREALAFHSLVGTGTTGSLIAERCDLEVKRYHSGPLGGDQQIGAEISMGRVDMVIFFWDPLSAQPHDPDIKALLRLSVLYNVPTACNISTADFMIQSPHFQGEYTKEVVDYAQKRPPVPL